MCDPVHQPEVKGEDSALYFLRGHLVSESLGNAPQGDLTVQRFCPNSKQAAVKGLVC